MRAAPAAADSLSSCAISSAVTSAPNPVFFQSSIARKVAESISSSRLGRSRAARIEVTASAPAAKLLKPAATVTG